MAESRSSGYSLFFVFIVGLLAHSCGEDEGRQKERSKARSEIATLEDRHRLEVNRLKNDCPTERGR